MLTSLSIVTLCNCSSSSDSTTTPTATKSVSVKIDGVQKNFSKVEIVQEATTENGIARVDIHIKAMNPDNETEYFEFGIGKGDHGDDQLWAFIYVNNGILYLGAEPEQYVAGLPNTVTVSTDNRVAGNFSGRVISDGENHVLSDGTFDIALTSKP